jgi:integrase
LLKPEYERLEKLLFDHLDTDERNCLILLLAMNTGARATELLMITKADLNDQDESVHIHGLKNSNDREIPLYYWLYKRIKAYAKTVEGEVLFPIGYHRLIQIWAQYRPLPKKFHSLRHTFAIRTYERTKDLRLVQVALGHRRIANTMVYADYIYSQQELRKLLL